MKPVLREPDASFDDDEEYDPENDLFATPELLPKKVQAVLTLFENMDESYEECQRFEDALKPLGYTFDWYLTAQPYNLRKIKSPSRVMKAVYKIFKPVRLFFLRLF